MIDQQLHKLENVDETFDLNKFESQENERIGMPGGIILRHRPPHFQREF